MTTVKTLCDTSACFQGIVAINKSIESKAFHTKPVLLQAFQKAKTNSGGRVHFLGLVSDGGVHSHIKHLEAFLEAAKMAGVEKSFVHFFSDGRDTSPTSGGEYILCHHSFYLISSIASYSLPYSQVCAADHGVH